MHVSMALILFLRGKKRQIALYILSMLFVLECIMPYINLTLEFVAPPCPSHMEINVDSMSFDPLNDFVDCVVAFLVQDGLPLVHIVTCNVMTIKYNDSYTQMDYEVDSLLWNVVL